MKLPTGPISLRGGLDLVTPAVAKPPGFCIAARNYEPASDGYRRMGGYERFDGQSKPSVQTYYKINVTTVVGTIAAGSTVTGATSGATGIAVVALALADTYLIVRRTTGTFVTAEALQVSAVTKATSSSAAVEGPVVGFESSHDTWLRAAIEQARALITSVTGSGSILGFFTLNGSQYVIRNNAGGSAAVMWKATTAGWSTQDLGREVAFTSGGVHEIVAGEVITGATSAATATVRRVILTSGSWSAGDAAGRLIVNGQAGNFQAENLDISGFPNSATIAANTTANALPAGGRYDTTEHNFRGAGGSVMTYLANGVGKAFEFDGTVIVFITTGMTTDTPSHVCEHKNHLFLTFPGGSLQHSSIGEPQEWDVVTGAAELSLGHAITQLISGYGQVLVVMGRNQVNLLYGSSVDDWELVPTSEDSGGIEWTASVMGMPVYYDDAGIRRLKTTTAWGDFVTGTDSIKAHPLIVAKRTAGVTPVAAARCKVRTLYFLFYNNKTGLFVYYGRKEPEIMAFELDHQVTTIHVGEDSSGNQEIYFGDDTGYVFQFNKGTSFDGQAVEAYIRLAYNHLGKPSVNKVWKGVQLELTAAPAAEIFLTADFDYGNPDQPGQPEAEFNVSGGGGFWNEDNWNQFYWSNPSVGQAIGELEGFGPSCSLAIISESTYEEPHVLHGLTFNYAERGYTRAA